MMIKYLKGDATSPQAKGNKIIAHVCNNQKGWGAGFVLALSRKWPEPEQSYRQWRIDFALGNVQIVATKEKSVFVANMIAQKGFGGVAIRYDKLRECLVKLCVEAKKLNASVHMPRIGCGLAGGSWQEVEPIIIEELCNNGISVTVYDL
jgi:O-acetyl-ADP-ribose deacetylase (regulator of RNase III)